MEKPIQIRVKNMVCPRCVQAVKHILTDLAINFRSVDLGVIDLDQHLNEKQHQVLSQRLKEQGFEILESKNASLIQTIKNTLIHQIHHSDEILSTNYSEFLEQKLDQDYAQMSRLFSQVEGLTIEKYITRLKVEKAKEWILYDEKGMAEIAFLLGYSSAAYLSSLFKKETGMTPSQFKQNSGKRISLDEL